MSVLAPRPSICAAVALAAHLARLHGHLLPPPQGKLHALKSSWQLLHVCMTPTATLVTGARLGHWCPCMNACACLPALTELPAQLAPQVDEHPLVRSKVLAQLKVMLARRG